MYHFTVAELDEMMEFLDAIDNADTSKARAAQVLYAFRSGGVRWGWKTWFGPSLCIDESDEFSSRFMSDCLQTGIDFDQRAVSEVHHALATTAREKQRIHVSLRWYTRGAWQMWVLDRVLFGLPRDVATEIVVCLAGPRRSRG